MLNASRLSQVESYFLINPSKCEEATEEKWIIENIIEALYLNDDMSGCNIPPYRDLERKEIEFVKPEAEPLKIKFESNDTVDRILQILLCKSIRRGAKGLIQPFIYDIREKIRFLVNHNAPISFVLPSLPFKDQSPFGTNAPIDHVDLGEYCLFAQLQRIITAINQVYAPGAHFAIICDGNIYADIFVENNLIGAGKYKSNCNKIKDEYSLYNDITLYDMKELFFRVPNWVEIEKNIINQLWNLYHHNETVRYRLDLLAKRFIFYTQISEMSYQSFYGIYNMQSSHQWLHETLLIAAIKYASIHLTMRKTQIVSQSFPFSIRCTVHPKSAAQLPLHLTNNHNTLLPYNGVAVVSKHKLELGYSLFQAMRVKRFYDVLSLDNVTAIYTNKAEYPLYYQIT